MPSQSNCVIESTPVLKTARLLLTPLQLSDAPAIQDLFPHWEVVRYLDSRVPGPYPDDGALAYVRDIALPAIAAGREWHWMMCNRRSAAFTYTMRLEKTGAFGFRRDGSVNGMREPSEVISAYWLRTFGRSVMRVQKDVKNDTSRRVSLS